MYVKRGFIVNSEQITNLFLRHGKKSKVVKDRICVNNTTFLLHTAFIYYLTDLYLHKGQMNEGNKKMEPLFYHLRFSAVSKICPLIEGQKTLNCQLPNLTQSRKSQILVCFFFSSSRSNFHAGLFVRHLCKVIEEMVSFYFSYKYH